MLGTGDSIGVFQIESSGMRSVLRQMKADKIEDIINNAYVALNDAKDSYRHYMLFTDQQTHADQSTESAHDCADE